MCKKNNSLLVFTLVCILVGLFASATPFLDIENEGLSEVLDAEEFLLFPNFFLPCSSPRPSQTK